LRDRERERERERERGEERRGEESKQTFLLLFKNQLVLQCPILRDHSISVYAFF
jgi:hypothetical protein